jgi:hypothetical protein
VTGVNEFDFPVTLLRGYRFISVGDKYNFQLEIINTTPLLNVRRITLSLCTHVVCENWPEQKSDGQNLRK